MNLRSMFGKARKQAEEAVEKRGGTEALKADAAELKNIATGPGTIKEKAKHAADALKDPGAKDGTTPGTTAPSEPSGPAEPPTTPSGGA